MAKLKAATDFSAPRAKIWEFESDSSPGKRYQAILYVNGTTSCNCRGWARHTTFGGGRTCRHVAAIEMGTADDTCLGMNDYSAEGLPESVLTLLATNKTNASSKSTSSGKRKLAI